MGISTIMGAISYSCIDIYNRFYCCHFEADTKMKVVFTCFRGSKDNHEPAYTVREQVNGLFSIYQGSHPLQKEIINLPVAVNIIMNKMNIWEKI